MLSEGDERIKAIVEKNNGKEEFPIILIQDICIGNVNDLEGWVVSEKLDSLLEKVYTSQHPRYDTKSTSSLENHIEEVKQQKKLLQDQIDKAQLQNNVDAIEELKNSVYLLDRDLVSMNKIVALKEEKKNSTSPNSSSQPIPIGSSHIRDSSISSFSTNDPGIVNKAVETSKWWMKGVSTAISSVSSYLTWNTPEVVSTSPPKEYKDERGSGYAEFEVLQINWYWRQQKRILRFSKDRFLRINPYTKELRAVHYYRTIQDIVVAGKTFMTVSFTDSSTPEYYQSVDLDKIITVLTEKALPTVIPVTHVQE